MENPNQFVKQIHIQKLELRLKYPHLREENYEIVNLLNLHPAFSKRINAETFRDRISYKYMICKADEFGMDICFNVKYPREGNGNEDGSTKLYYSYNVVRKRKFGRPLSTGAWRTEFRQEISYKKNHEQLTNLSKKKNQYPPSIFQIKDIIFNKVFRIDYSFLHNVPRNKLSDSPVMIKFMG